MSIYNPSNYAKKLALLFVIFSLFLSAASAQQVTPAPAGIVKPDAGALKRTQAGKAYLVDVQAMGFLRMRRWDGDCFEEVKVVS